jgi:uncharacterized membrane-anchored protein YjiN (DUF445 family)
MTTDLEDLQRSLALRRMRLTAAGLLVVMLLADAAARLGEDHFPLLSFLRAFSEAAIIGGLADWFAVTALFRRPFGLPIPHTAIIPRNKYRIGEALGNFVANNFLSPDVLLPKVRALNLAGRLASWLSQEGNARFSARRLAAAVPHLIAAMQDEPVRQMLRDAAAERLQAIQAAPLLSRILAILVAGGQHLALFDIGITAAREFVQTNQEQIYKTINDKSSWWVPEWIDVRLAKHIVSGLLETLEDMETPEHPWRLQFQGSVDGLINALAHAPETQRQAEALKEEIIGHPEVQAYLESLWLETKRALLADLALGGRIELALSGALSGLALRMGEESRLQDVVNAWSVRALSQLLVPNRTRIGNFMAGVVRNWDTQTLVGKMELQFGRDLQYIRINGTLVGGLAGVVVHALSRAFG